MCKVLEDRLIEEATRTSRRIAANLIAEGKLTIEEIAKTTELSVEEVQALADLKKPA